MSKLIIYSRVLLLALSFFCLTGRSTAQDVPELEVWWEIRGGGDANWLASGFSYLPGFDTLYGGEGHNAIAMITGFPQDDSTAGCETWYMREKGDQENHFSWMQADAADIVSGDFDGDGIQDYCTWMGRIYRGRQNGLPPDTPAVAQYIEMFEWTSRYLQVRDLNQDGYDDVVVRKGTLARDVVRILMGGPDLTQLQVIYVYDHAADLRTEDFFIGLPQQLSSRGKQMMVTQIAHLDPGQVIIPIEVSFVLWELNFTQVNDTLALERVMLDSISDAELRPEEGFDYVSGTVAHFENGDLGVFMVPGKDRDEVQLFRLINDRFEVGTVFEPTVTPASTVIPLSGSVNSDTIPDWGFGTRFGFVVCSAFDSQLSNAIEIGRVAVDCDGFATVRYIGDVTGDGIGDLATSQYSSTSCFRIYEGVKTLTSTVERAETPRPFTLGQHYPNPAPRNGMVTLPLTVKQFGTYTLELFNLRGELISRLLTKDMAAGEHSLRFGLAGLNLAAGFYVLRLRNSSAPGHVHERGLLLR